MTLLNEGMRTKWNALKATVRATWFWRVYGVCAMKRTWTKLLVAVSLCGLMVVARFGPGIFTPVLDLEQMHRKEGLVIGASINPKGHNSLRIRTDAGEKRTYLALSYVGFERLHGAAGQRVTVWSQRVYDGWPPFVYEGLMEAKLGNTMLLNYKMATEESSRRDYIEIVRFFLYLFTIPLLVVGWACRKGADT
jgi:hypothetical protein